jgi:hypothetical protein
MQGLRGELYRLKSRTAPGPWDNAPPGPIPVTDPQSQKQLVLIAASLNAGVITMRQARELASKVK